MEKVDWFDINKDDIQRRESALRTMLRQFDVPDMRRDTTSHRNLKWLNRNISANNGDHPMHDTARDILTWLLRWHQVGKVIVGDR